MEGPILSNYVAPMQPRGKGTNISLPGEAYMPPTLNMQHTQHWDGYIRARKLERELGPYATENSALHRMRRSPAELLRT